ncbi:VIT domain-containing protein [[Eubacterium] cellulosolvens]
MGLKREKISGVTPSYRFRNKAGFLSSWIFILLILSSAVMLINPLGAAAGASSENAEIEYLTIETDINNNYAITKILVKLNNPNEHPIDDTFSFRIPNKAFISNFSLSTANQTYYAKIVPKEIALQKFESALLNGTDAGLMEAKGKNFFSYSVSLSPRQELLVGLRYEQFLEKSLGGYEYLIPLKDGTANRNIKDFTIGISVKAKMFVRDIEVENYRDTTNIDWLSAHEVSVSYHSSLTTPQDDFLIKYELGNPPVNGTMLDHYDGTTEYFFHIFSPQRTDLGDHVMPKEIIFVLDKSGSMSGRKIEQLKTAFDQIINQLPTQDSFNIIMFDNTIQKYQSELIMATSDNRAKAVNYINGISAGGSTNINDAISTALSMFEISESKVPIIVMLTDGLPTAGVTNPSSIRENIKNSNTAEVAIFCLGFGFDVDFDFLKAMSLENYGMAIRIYEGEDASEQITNFYDTISTPLLKGLIFCYSEGAHEVYPDQVSQLFEGSEVVVVGKYSNTSNTIIATVDASSWDGMRTFEESFALEKNSNNSFIPRFWAYAKIMYLLDKLAVVGENDSLVENITELGLAYSFVTPYTSLFVELPEKVSNAEELVRDIDMDDDLYSPTPGGGKPKMDIDMDGNGEGDECGTDSTALISFPIIIMIIALVIIIAIAGAKRKRLS